MWFNRKERRKKEKEESKKKEKLNEFNENDTTESIVSKHVTSGLIDILDSIIDDMPYSIHLFLTVQWANKFISLVQDKYQETLQFYDYRLKHHTINY